MLIQTKDIIRKHPLFDSTPDFVLWPMTLTFCMDITLDQLNKPWKTAWRWQEHGQKGVTDRWMVPAIHRAARSQLNNWRTTMTDCFASDKLHSQAKTRHHWNAPFREYALPKKCPQMNMLWTWTIISQTGQWIGLCTSTAKDAYKKLDLM